jgi:VCBS repeat-containing protein
VAVAVLLAAIFLTACVPVPDTGDAAMSAKEKSMKGYELYSWQADGAWHYALVVGTNRLKTFDEITSPSVAVKSLDELRSQLARLARGEEIVWTTWTDDRLTLPPQPVIDEIAKACQELSLTLTIASE